MPIRLARRDTSPRMWLDMKTVTPCSRASSMRRWRISTIPAGSKPSAGSSRRSSAGLCSSALASPRRCALPCDNVPARRSAYSVKPSRSMTPSTACGAVPGRRRRMASRFSRTVSSGYASGVSTMYPTEPHGFLSPTRILVPSTRASPEVGLTMPSSRRMVVVLPAPLSPRKA